MIKNHVRFEIKLQVDMKSKLILLQFTQKDFFVVKRHFIALSNNTIQLPADWHVSKES